MKITRTRLREIIKETIKEVMEEGFSDGTKKWEATRKKNAEVLGYKLDGTPDYKVEVKHAHDGVSHVGEVEEKIKKK